MRNLIESGIFPRGMNHVIARIVMKKNVVK